jgi:hypothetical protein
MPSGLAAATPRNRDPEPPEQDVPCVRLKSNQPSFHATQLGSLADYAERSASPLMPGFELQRIRCPPRSRHVVSIARTLAVWATRMARDQGAITDQEEWQCS